LEVAAMSFSVKRVYDAPSPRDGLRILVDRLWPRGMSKESARVDEWLRDVAPSTALRQWYHHDTARFAEFRRRYLAELQRNPEPLGRLRTLGQRRRVTLLYGARDEEHNQAVVLKQLLDGKGS
jgi:uncharacterized protein YeaO (DUF488 family)